MSECDPPWMVVEAVDPLRLVVGVVLVLVLVLSLFATIVDVVVKGEVFLWFHGGR